MTDGSEKRNVSGLNLELQGSHDIEKRTVDKANVRILRVQ